MQAENVIHRLAKFMSEGGVDGEHSVVAAEVDALLAAHEDLVYAICLHFLGDPTLARELCQTVLLKAYLDLANFEGEQAFTPWLYNIARDQCLALLQKNPDDHTSDPIVDLVDEYAHVLTGMRRQDRIALVDIAAQHLSTFEQEVVHLYYVENIPRDRLAGILCCSEEDIETHLGSSQARLSGLLEHYLAELQQGHPITGDPGE